MLYLEGKGNKVSVVQNRLIDIVNYKEVKLFNEDIIYHVIKTLAVKYAAKMNKLLMIPSIKAKLLK